MKELIAITLILTGCANAVQIDGLWIEEKERVLLKFSNDSVIVNTLETTIFRDTLAYTFSKNNLTWYGLNPILNESSSKTYQYRLSGDSLQYWNEKERYLYLRSTESTYLDHLLKKDGLDIRLPKAVNTRLVARHFDRITIRVGINSHGVRIFVGDIEANIGNLNFIIKAKIAEKRLANPIAAYLLIDNGVTMDLVSMLLSNLRLNDITSISFVVNDDTVDPNTDDFGGLTIRIPRRTTNFITE